MKDNHSVSVQALHRSITADALNATVDAAIVELLVIEQAGHVHAHAFATALAACSLQLGPGLLWHCLHRSNSRDAEVPVSSFPDLRDGQYHEGAPSNAEIVVRMVLDHVVDNLQQVEDDEAKGAH